MVDAPVDKVFGYLADVTKWHLWGPKHTKYKMTSEGPLCVGSTFTEIQRISEPPSRSGAPGGSWDFHAKWEVTEFVPNERLAFAGGGLGIRESRFMEVQTSEHGTRITIGGELVRIPLWILPIWPFVYLLLLLFSPLRRWREARMLGRLKKRVERLR